MSPEILKIASRNSKGDGNQPLNKMHELYQQVINNNNENNENKDDNIAVGCAGVTKRTPNASKQDYRLQGSR